jgi:ketosteroid isomerase-like protein
MAEPLTTGQLAALIGQGGPFSAGESVTGDQIVEIVSELLRHTAHPEFRTVMTSESVTQEYSGLEGFREAWSDWLYPYERFRIEFDDVMQLDDRVVFLVRQVVTTRHSGVEVETPSASIWWVEDGQIREAAFYLDRRAGLKAAGLDPDRPQRN